LDSLTQFVLGAGVSAALLGPKIGVRNAVLLGGVLGTLPDLDTFVPAADPVEAFVSHRGATHSFLMQALATPVVGELLVRTIDRLRDNRVTTYCAVLLIFVTHSLIDAMTVYGTQVFWPLSKEPLGVGSIFIIDPLYTLPLLAVAVWGVFQKNWSARYGGWLKRALVVSTLYMLATIPIQYVMKDRAETLLAQYGVNPDRILATPPPLNVLFWKAVAIDGDRYFNMYLPLFGSGSEIPVYAHPRRLDLITCLDENPTYQKLAAFSDGFYRVIEIDGQVVVSDLRMGLTPTYVFQFAVAELAETGLTPLPTPERVRQARTHEGDLDWLSAGILQSVTPRPVEEEASVAVRALGAVRTRSVADGCQAG